MEKSQTEFVQECLAEIASLKERMAALEAKLEAFQADEPKEEATPVMDEIPEDTPVDFTDVEMDVETPVILSDSSVNPSDSSVILSEAKNLPAEEPAPLSASKQEEIPDETAGLPWRKDKPGLRVKNIRSGISLYDRALFIGTLFKEDFSLYENTIRDLNELVSLDQAVDYIRTHFPQWNLHSDVVYNFMMSIRKKLG